MKVLEVTKGNTRACMIHLFTQQVYMHQQFNLNTNDILPNYLQGTDPRSSPRLRFAFWVVSIASITQTLASHPSLIFRTQQQSFSHMLMIKKLYSQQTDHPELSCSIIISSVSKYFVRVHHVIPCTHICPVTMSLTS